MSATAFHLNLLTPHERKSSSPVRARILLPLIAGIGLAFVVAWGAFVGLQLAYVSSQADGIRSEMDALHGEHAVVAQLKSKFRNLQTELEQYSYYMNGRRPRGELLRRLAYAIPESVTLTALTLPPPPEQNLRPPVGSKQPPLQGPTETSERAQLRLTGVASSEQDVFQLMTALRSGEFTNDVIIVEHPASPADESPRVFAFRQDAATRPDGRQDVFFDIAYTIKPREFVK